MQNRSEMSRQGMVLHSVEVVFFFKQKTAYEIEYGLVGSEMCIRDSPPGGQVVGVGPIYRQGDEQADQEGNRQQAPGVHACLLYTSDAADERSSVDLGGRRIIKKKK